MTKWNEIDKIEISYKDDIMDIVDKINSVLRPNGFDLFFDNEEHDGFEIIYLRKLIEV